jgi:hypothetical protein
MGRCRCPLAAGSHDRFRLRVASELTMAMATEHSPSSGRIRTAAGDRNRVWLSGKEFSL